MQIHRRRVGFDASTAIPAELRAVPQWVAWRREIRNGKPTKLPIASRTGSAASSTDPTTWSDFETAYAAVSRWRCDGLGFVFSRNDPFVGVDLDHAIEATRVADWAASIVRRLSSYCEVSPSGAGLHIIVRGTLPPGRRKRGDIEMYEAGRYFTVTGGHVQGTPMVIEERTRELAALHSETFGPALDLPTAMRPAGHPTLDDRALLGCARAARNGRKFRQLYDHGDWQGVGYASRSEADLALCAMIAFWTGPDPDRIDRCFRRSALMRAKWDASSGSQTYGARTIDRALMAPNVMSGPSADFSGSIGPGRPAIIPEKSGDPPYIGYRRPRRPPYRVEVVV
jgi:primase-polymerase (primpol)-like protein